MENFDNLSVEINPEYTMKKKQSNGLYLSQEEIEILDDYNINYLSVKSLGELIFLIQREVDFQDEDALLNLLEELSERDYYENYNK